MNERVILFDKNPFESAILSAALQLHGISVVGQVRNTEIARRLIQTLNPDALIADMDGAPVECLELINAVRKLKPDLGILLTTVLPDLRILGLRDSQLPPGSKIVLKRNLTDLNLICSSVTDSVSSAVESAPSHWVKVNTPREDEIMREKISALTDIQIETLRMLCDGLSNKEIAKRRFVSEKAIEQIVSRIAEELGYTYDTHQNLRVLLVAEYFHWLGVARK